MKKIVLIFVMILTLPCFIGVGNVCYAEANTKPDYSLCGTFNGGITGEILSQEYVQAYSRSVDSRNFAIDLYKVGAQPTGENDIVAQAYRGEGVISITGAEEEFSVSGNILEVQIDSDTMGLIGNLTGEISSGTFIAITVQTIPTEQKLFAYVSVGFVTYSTNPDVAVFGDWFDEMDILVQALCDKQGKTVVATEEIDVVNDYAGIEDGGLSAYTTAVGEGDTQLRTYSSNGMTDEDGIHYDIATLSLYAPVRINPRMNYEFGVKINANLTNARSYAYSQYNMQAGGVWASSGMVEMVGESGALNFLQLDPESESFDATMHVPLENLAQGGWIFSFFPVDISVGISGIEAQLLKYGGSNRYNHAKWSHFYSHDVDYGSSGPISSSNGYAGRAVGTWLDDVSSTVCLNFVANGYITFTYNSSSYITGDSFIGNFTVRVDDLSTYIYVDPNA